MSDGKPGKDTLRVDGKKFKPNPCLQCPLFFFPDDLEIRTVTVMDQSLVAVSQR